MEWSHTYAMCWPKIMAFLYLRNDCTDRTLIWYALRGLLIRGLDSRMSQEWAEPARTSSPVSALRERLSQSCSNLACAYAPINCVACLAISSRCYFTFAHSWQKRGQSSFVKNSYKGHTIGDRQGSQRIKVSKGVVSCEVSECGISGSFVIVAS